MNHHAFRTSLTIAIVLLAILAVGAGTLQSALAVENPSVEIHGAWARVGLEGGNTAVYMTIANGEDQDLTLVGAETDVARATEVHETSIDANQVMRMQRVDAVAIPAGGTAEFRPGGLHVMLLGLDKPLHEGDQLLVRLIFAGYDPVSIAVPVRHADGQAHGHVDEHAHGHANEHMHGHAGGHAGHAGM